MFASFAVVQFLYYEFLCYMYFFDQYYIQFVLLNVLLDFIKIINVISCFIFYNQSISVLPIYKDTFSPNLENFFFSSALGIFFIFPNHPDNSNLARFLKQELRLICVLLARIRANFFSFQVLILVGRFCL